jgi:hypothetical protein
VPTQFITKVKGEESIEALKEADREVRLQIKVIKRLKSKKLS